MIHLLYKNYNIGRYVFVKVTFIGTSAGEGYPGVWCECVNCRKARQWGGRNIRGNACSMIDDDFLIDFSAHFVAQYCIRSCSLIL